MVEAHEPYFVKRRDCSIMFDFSSFQNITIVLRMFAYGIMTVFTDEWLDWKSNSNSQFKMFVKVIVLVSS